MRTWTCTTIGALLFVSAPASASWRAANPEVAAAARTPRIAAALAAADKMDRAILTRDAKSFSSVLPTMRW
jgi:hypothetical protein